MLKQTLDRDQADGRADARPAQTLPLKEATRLINRLYEVGMLKEAFDPPGEWILWPNVLIGDFVTTIKEYLSKAGWQRTLNAFRQHNRQAPDAQWDLAQPADFVAALKFAITLPQTQPAPQSQPQTRPVDEKRDVVVKPPAAERSSEALPNLTPELQRQMREMLEAQMKPARSREWLLSPRALRDRLSARAKRARTEAQIENAASEAALYAARMTGTDVERDVAVARVDRLRTQLRNQLRVFCEEQGLPRPAPFSREEAYYLHMLNAYYVALAEAEDEIAQRGAQLARRQIALESERAEARISSRLLPGLLAAQREINPMRERFMWERLRHKVALLVGAPIGTFGGALLGMMESASNVLIPGIGRYAPILAPALLIGLVSLAAQTYVYSGPFTLSVAAGFIARAMWNGALALGATIVAYGCWQYFHLRQDESDTLTEEAPVSTQTTTAHKERHRDTEASHTPPRSHPVDSLPGRRAAAHQSTGRLERR